MRISDWSSVVCSSDLSNGMLTRYDLLKDDPKLVKDFNDAMVEAMIFAIDNRDDAVKIFLKHNPQLDPDLTRAGLDVAIAHLVVPEVHQHGIGPMSKDKKIGRASCRERVCQYV